MWGIKNGKEALAGDGPPRKRETWVGFLGYEEVFGVPKARVWWT